MFDCNERKRNQFVVFIPHNNKKLKGRAFRANRNKISPWNNFHKTSTAIDNSLLKLNKIYLQSNAVDHLREAVKQVQAETFYS